MKAKSEKFRMTLFKRQAGSIASTTIYRMCFRGKTKNLQVVFVGPPDGGVDFCNPDTAHVKAPVQETRSARQALTVY